VNFDPEGQDLFGEVVPALITEALPHSLRGALAAREAVLQAAGMQPA